MDFLAFVFRFLTKGVGFFLLAFLLWEVVALIFLSGSLTNFYTAVGDPQGMIFGAAFFAALWALPIVGFIFLGYLFSRLFQAGQVAVFLGICAMGVAFLFFLFGAGVWFASIPTLSVVILFLARFHHQSSNAVRSGR